MTEPNLHNLAGQQSTILILHGPNLNMLGRREPQYYGADTLASINSRLCDQGAAAGYVCTHFQSNSEAALIERVHTAFDDGTAFIIINPAAFTHTSIVLRDALAMVKLPFVEVHLSNVHAREPFRHHSYFSDLAVGVICGLGAAGYSYALEHAIDYLKRNQST
ncbi:type II 3-dehydroquinate dehydratase [Chitinimonas sp. BJB300]|uniref:type II 3-dehydroquinate dehydratase n=1 Tax=Chitinimonas sp. BJB300 TaxID=1559339 RepID=UPI000C10F7E5|nr:type II 3-dehydroquinate dehydratase [Chitinimonas sp. BJB300]PHV11599.1 type II 3-dehydroquinate dehydratase [Chitinimonas sp. BJB300]TSJ88087.1 type II 3-dehydroquinate dehydratase [Chitinimonas sp. BJB300]